MKSFVEKHDGLFIKDYHLHDTHVVIDASNLICVLYKDSQKHERRDLFGGDLVQYGRFVMGFFDNLRRCKIVPVLVFDGAQTYDQNKSKTAEKHRRALERFQNVMSINRLGFGDFILPATATNVFRSIAVDQEIKIVQCMFEADAEVARISNELKCPVISNDSDFYLIHLPAGLISIDLLQYEQTRRFLDDQDTGRPNRGYNYIDCCLFKQENLLRYVPGLNIKCLPILGVLAGNDFVAAGIFENICSRLSARHDPRDASRSFKKVTGNRQHQKIVNLLYFLCNKTPNEVVNLVCAQVAKTKRARLKALIKANLTVYDIPIEEDFERELRNLYWQGFRTTYSDHYDHDELLFTFDRTMEGLVSWLRKAMEKSVMSYRCLELANRNIIFIINHMDDPQLPSAHQCQLRAMRVTLALLRSSRKDRSTCVVYDRVGQSYSKQTVKAMDYLENFGGLNFTFYDLPKLTESIRRSILCATFHASYGKFESNVAHFYGWFEPQHAEEFLTLKLLMDFVDIESQTAKLWRHFRQATLLCLLYYFSKYHVDRVLSDRLQCQPSRDEEFITDFVALVERRHLAKMPVLSKRRKYNCRLMHQITQLQSSIISFNGLNAFLGDVMTRMRTEYWLNSCLIYNLAEHLHDKTLKFATLPEIVHFKPL